jgi:hypothetical protein
MEESPEGVFPRVCRESADLADQPLNETREGLSLVECHILEAVAEGDPIPRTGLDATKTQVLLPVWLSDEVGLVDVLPMCWRRDKMQAAVTIGHYAGAVTDTDGCSPARSQSQH